MGIVQVKDLSKVFAQSDGSEIYAVDHIDFSVNAGEILGIVGESGSGKSTAAKLLTRLIEPTSGTIIVDGEDITKLKGRKLRNVYGKIQMVFQNPTGSFDPRRTIGNGIGESLKNRGDAKDDIERKVADLLERCGLSAETAYRYPHEISGGQCQRAAIARALAAAPKILILDEATSSLDVTVQKKIIELLRQLQKEKNLTYLFICHNIALVQQFCTSAVVMYEGKIVEEGTPDDIIMSPKSEYTRMLIDSVF